MCPFRHSSGEQTVVCKHWLRGLCKRGDQCEFLHEYDVTKMPECYFYSKFGECSNRECPFLHIDPASRIKDCPWYNRGFCKQGECFVLGNYGNGSGGLRGGMPGFYSWLGY
nr:putative cleavage and polyadenylation specificity factor subunit 4-like protein [Pelodiscus sinensis]|eukprot:XP_014426973.1 putative cleavage and polyadenylation specificity factor subunit 4-like protein [Pelodiscus sinensis]